MIFYDYYADVPDADLRDFVSKQELGRFITASGAGQPHVGLYPFLYLGETIEIHLHRNDEQLADLLTNKKCAFEVGEIHGTIPSNWIHATNAMFATAYHRTVIFECEAEVSEDAEILAAQQRRLMAHYQPAGGHAPVSTEHAMYRGPFKEIRALTLTARAQGKVEARAKSNPRTTRDAHRRAAQTRPADRRRRSRCNSMDTRSRSETLIPMPWYRAVMVWMAFMLVETAHGAVRELFVAPAIGGLRARQIGVPVGCVIVFVVAWFAARWMGAITRRQQLIIGGLWVCLTLAFEIFVGFAVGAPWEQITADLDLTKGGLMSLGLAFMFVTPMLVARPNPRVPST